MILAHKRSASGSITNSRSDGRSTWTLGSVLGQGYSSPGKSQKFLGFSPKSTTRIPHPQQSSSIFHAILNGLRKCISVTESNIVSLKSSLECSSINSQQQLKSLERHHKHLEFQMSKFEELIEQYTLNEQLREGARTMAQAYSQSTGKKKGMALNNVKSGFLECTEALSVLEGQIESFMGTFLIQIKGIQGFARMCAGDVYEITIKYGDQKCRSRGKICRDNQQSWERRKAIFKCLLGDVLLIKAVELKMFGKQIVLGHKYFETKDLFSPFSQLLTISINASGSLKLSLIITWNPLERGHTNEEVMTLRHPIQGQGSPKQKKRPPLISVLDTEIAIPQLTTSSSGSDSVLSSRTGSQRSSMTESLYEVKPGHLNLDRDLACQSHNSSSSESVDYLDPSTNGKKMCIHFERNYTLQEYFDDCVCHKSPSADFTKPQAITISPVKCLAQEISALLTDIQGQYPQLEPLQSTVRSLNGTEGGDNSGDDSVSEYSVSIESALQCFDFLESEADEDMEVDNSQIDSITSSPGDRSHTGTTLNQDQALIYHLKYIKTLIQNLGMATPFQFAEVGAIKKLMQQTDILKMIMQQSTNNFWSSTKFNYLEELWSNVTSKKSVMFVPLSLFRSNVQPYVSTSLGVCQSNLVPGVIDLLISNINDNAQCYHGEDAEDIITLYQISLYEPMRLDSMDKHLQDLANEVFMEGELKSGDLNRVKNALDDFLRRPYMETTINNLLSLLVEENQISQLVKNAIRISNLSLKKKIKDACFNGLLSPAVSVRTGSCVALKVLEATDALSHLCHVCQHDLDDQVRKSAKETISSFGSESMNIFMNCQLTNHGFQGLSTRF